MWKKHVWAAALSGMGLASAVGCESESRSLTSVDNNCEVPCDDDPSKTCTVPCPPNGAAAGIGPGSGGSAGSGGGTGAAAGAGGAPAAVGVTGSVVQFTTLTFDDVAPYLDPITIVAPGFETLEVQANAMGGSFALSGAASGLAWVLAKDLDGAGGAYSTYSIQLLDGATPIAVPVVPLDVIDTIGTQIDVVSLNPGDGHVVLEIDDASGAPIEGAELALAGGSVGYAVGPGQFSAAAGATGSLGLAAALNVPLPAPAEVTVTITVNATQVTALVQMAPDTVTYARVGVP